MTRLRATSGRTTVSPATALAVARVVSMPEDSGLVGWSRARTEADRRGVGGVRGRPRQADEPGLAVVQPARLGLGLEDQLFEDEQPGHVVPFPGPAALDGGERLGLEPGVVLHRLHGVPALRLDDIADVDARGAHGHGELDGQLVTGGAGAVHGLLEPGPEFGAAAVGDRVERVAGRVLAVLGDHAVAFEAAEGRVDLAHVERPGGAGAGLELRAELGAVPGAAFEEGEKPVADRHTQYVYRVCRCGQPT